MNHNYNHNHNHNRNGHSQTSSTPQRTAPAAGVSSDESFGPILLQMEALKEIVTAANVVIDEIERRFSAVIAPTTPMTTEGPAEPLATCGAHDTLITITHRLNHTVLRLLRFSEACRI